MQLGLSNSCTWRTKLQSKYLCDVIITFTINIFKRLSIGGQLVGMYTCSLKNVRASWARLTLLVRCFPIWTTQLLAAHIFTSAVSANFAVFTVSVGRFTFVLSSRTCLATRASTCAQVAGRALARGQTVTTHEARVVVLAIPVAIRSVALRKQSWSQRQWQSLQILSTVYRQDIHSRLLGI
jgi:hypothetical protein